MPPSPQLVALARAAAAAHGLDPALVCAVVEQESAWNTWAVRYEPGFLSRYVAPLYTAGKIGATEAYTRAMSWGLMQVMGQVAREEGLPDATPIPQLCDPAVGLEYGCRVLKTKFAAANPDASETPSDAVTQRALLLWNGGANKSYPAQVLARLAHYSRA
ncbi:MAG: transglycosylase SLT domain-containing protein [Candidatus Acidiferrales bacterium]